MPRDYNGVDLKNGDVVTFEANVKQVYDGDSAFFEIDSGPNFTCNSQLARIRVEPTAAPVEPETGQGQAPEEGAPPEDGKVPDGEGRPTVNADHGGDTPPPMSND